MNNEVLLALILKKVEERFQSLSENFVRGQRGPRGLQGPAGQDFHFEDHVEKFKEFAREVSIKFSDLSQEEVESLRGPKGLDGKDGADGRDFNFEEHEETIKTWAKDFALKFEDLSPEQIESLRGPKGKDGSDGVDGLDFNFDDHRDSISGILSQLVKDSHESLRLKFSDLTDDERESIRGPRGRDGRDGKNFVFDEHREFFETLKPKFADFTADEIESLRLHFSDLTEEEKAQLKLRFEDLTEEDRLKIRGPRGPKGQKGSQGIQGEKGEIGGIGPRGLPGPQGITGLTGARGKDGVDGRDGVDGKDAAYVTDISVEKVRSDVIEFVFTFSDGSKIVSNQVKLPAPNNYFVGGGGGGGSGGGGSGSGSLTFLDEGVSLGEATEVDFVGEGVTATKVGDRVTVNIPGGGAGTLEFFDEGISLGSASELDFQGLGVTAIKTVDRVIVNIDAGAVAGLLLDVLCDPTTYEGSMVRMEPIEITLYMSDWLALSDVDTLDETLLTAQAVNALADSYENANVIGVIEEKTSPTNCHIRLYGPTLAVFVGLDVTEEYYLSDTVPGGIVETASAPTASGHILLKVGQPIDPTRLLFSKGERLIRA